MKKYSKHLNLRIPFDMQFFAEMTMSTDLFDPEVIGDVAGAQFDNLLRFQQYATVDRTLEGTPGSTITRIAYNYIGAADELEEGVPMEPTKLTLGDKEVTISEFGKAVTVTERAVKINLPGTMDEAGRQIGMSLAERVEMNYIKALNETQLTASSAPVTPSAILDAVSVFDDETEGDYVLFINTKDYTELVKSLFEVGGAVQERAITTAQVSEIVGVRDIVKTRRLPKGTSFLQKQGAVEIILKAGVAVNSAHDILARTFTLAGNSYYGVNLYDESGVIRLGAALSDDGEGETP